MSETRKPELKAVVEKVWIPAHEDFFYKNNGEIYYSIDYPGRYEMKIVGFEEVSNGSGALPPPAESGG